MGGRTDPEPSLASLRFSLWPGRSSGQSQGLRVASDERGARAQDLEPSQLLPGSPGTGSREAGPQCLLTVRAGHRSKCRSWGRLSCEYALWGLGMLAIGVLWGLVPL